jgi:hypothetical protein
MALMLPLLGMETSVCHRAGRPDVRCSNSAFITQRSRHRYRSFATRVNHGGPAIFWTTVPPCDRARWLQTCRRIGSGPLALDLVTQELGIIALIRRGVRVLTASGDDLTDSSDPSRKMMRQIAGSFAEYEKARLVAKLRGARERMRAESGKCEGRKSWAEINPELVREAKRLRRRSPKGHQRSLRDVAAELAKVGFLNERGKPFSASSVAAMIGAALPRQAGTISAPV